MPDEQQQQDGGSTRVERVVLQVFSPASEAQFAGIDAALKRLGAMERQLRNVENRYRNLLKMGAENPIGRAPIPPRAPSTYGPSSSSPGGTRTVLSGGSRPPIRVTETPNEVCRTYREIGQDGRVHIVTKSQKKPMPGGSFAGSEEKEISRRIVYGERGNRSDADQAARDREAARLRQRRTEQQRIRQSYGPGGFEPVVKSNQDFRKFISDAEKADAAAQKLANTHRYLGKNMLENVSKVAAWTSSVSVLYGAVNMASDAAQNFVNIGYQQARLTQVYRGNAAEVSKLTDEILRMASVNGRSADESMQSAVQWARIFGTRREIAEATRVSMVAANVAELSVADATEQLASLVSVYNLKASQLNGVLGMLNATSNTYNVTNRDLLDGLSKTAAIAKQAGIGLAELQGIIGAGVGATGQSGSNIGQGLKSILGSLSQVQKQGTLREDFGFETTTGTGELKNMSEVIRELFIRYQALSEAERQTMLYSVAGKHQASRMASLLDNYVRSQVLAINAQLNLNSAEEENAKIKATLRAQLQGLATEWARFAKAQGDRGPSQLIGETTKALTNLLRLANTSGGSWASTGVIALLTVMGAKMTLAKIRMDEMAGRSGYLANSFAAVRGAIQTFQPALHTALDASALWVQRLAGIEAGSTAAASAVGKMRGSFALVAGSAASLAKLGAFALLAYGALKLLNHVTESLGVNSDSTNQSLGEFGVRAERAEKAAEGAAMAARLFASTQEAIKNARTDEGRKRIAGEALEAAYIPDSNATDLDREKSEKAAQLEAHRKVINALIDEKNLEAVSVEFGKLRAANEERHLRARQASYEALLKENSEIDREIRRLEKSPFGKKTDIDALKARREGNADKTTRMVLDDMAHNEDALSLHEQTSTQFKAFTNRQQLIAEGVKAVFDEMPGDTPMLQLNESLAANQTLLGVYEQQLAALKELRKQSGIPDMTAKELETAQKNKQAEIATFRESVSKEFSSATGLRIRAVGIGKGEFETVSQLANPYEHRLPTEAEIFDPKRQHGMHAIQSAESKYSRIQGIDTALAQAREGFDKARQMESELQGLQSQLAAAKTSDQAKEIEARIKEVQEKIKGTSASIMAQQSPQNIALTDTRERYGFHLNVAKAQADSFMVGEDEGSQFLEQQDRLRTSIRENEFITQHRSRIPGSGQTLADRDLENERAGLTALQHRTTLTAGLLQAKQRLLDLERQETNLVLLKNREYNRMLLTAGPAELLRKLAISKLGGKATAGQFFALSGEARRDVLDLPENSEDVRSNRRSQTAYRKFVQENAGSDRAVFDQMRQMSEAATKLMTNLAPKVPQDNGLGEWAGRAATNLNALAGAAERATAVLDRIGSMNVSAPAPQPSALGVAPGVAQDPNN